MIRHTPISAGAARNVAQVFLSSMDERWRHTIGVAERAGDLATALGVDAELLVTAAWLHDIGYAAPLVVTGFHPLDGARHLRDTGWPARVTGLVAHHSGARYVAVARGLGADLDTYAHDQDMLSDALTYADQCVGPYGKPMTPDERHREMLDRHGPSSWNAVVDHLRGPHLRAVVTRVERQLDAVVGALPPLSITCLEAR